MGVIALLGTLPWVRRLAWASLVANIGIILTGGAVRLTGSGLGCPTWPRCYPSSFTPHGAYSFHSAIEFGNRTLTFVLAAVAVLTLVSAWRSGLPGLRRLAVVLALGVPAQAVIGGITVLADLNPWLVSFHLLVSLAMVSVAVLYLWRIERPLARRAGPRPLAAVAWATYAVTWVTLYLGTVVTGSGPHAGDADVPRNGLDPRQLSQLHADVVFLLVGLTVALVLVLHALGFPPARRRPAVLLLAVQLAQGAIGFVQYFTDLPIVLVELHLLGASLLMAVTTWTLLHLRQGAEVEQRVLERV